MGPDHPPLRYAAIGDSYTEGVGDPHPNGLHDQGWADHLALRMAQTHAGGIAYANLAVRGKMLAHIVEEQLPGALALEPRPTLITLNGGGNDMLRPVTDIDRLVDLLRMADAACAEAGVPLVVVTGADPTGRLPLGARVHSKGHALTEATKALVAERAPVTRAAGAGLQAVANPFGDDELRRPGHWSPDRLHLGRQGHRRVAWVVHRTLTDVGLMNGEPHPEPLTPEHAPDSAVDEVLFYVRHVTPWVGRRILRRSSGDGRVGKLRDWHHVPTKPQPT